MWLRFRRSCCCVLSPFLPEDKSLLICTLNLTYFTTYLWKTAVFRCTLSNPSAKRCMPPPHPKLRPPPHPKLRRKLPEFSHTNPDESVWKISSQPDYAIFFCLFWNNNRPIHATGAPTRLWPQHAGFPAQISSRKREAEIGNSNNKNNIND